MGDIRRPAPSGLSQPAPAPLPHFTSISLNLCGGLPDDAGWRAKSLPAPPAEPQGQPTPLIPWRSPQMAKPTAPAPGKDTLSDASPLSCYKSQQLTGWVWL
ncbi:hypothetical protein [Kamptonema formosum]|uniref:hypothetical protein n=1 Tax=Kamptonema formosum TaxID=331992 RepID=UPI00036E8120|nr:hypothetical protein [Oscillatoria sp. PCC 10802]